MQILFDSIKCAEEVSFAINGKWDQCNGVELIDCDKEALDFAASLSESDYCEVGDACNLQRGFKFNISDLEMPKIASEMANTFNQNTQEDVTQFWESLSKVAQDFSGQAQAEGFEVEDLRLLSEGTPKSLMVLDESALLAQLDPSSIKPHLSFANAPDDTLRMLQAIAKHELSAEQFCVAKVAALEAIAQQQAKEWTLLDLVQLWEQTPELSEFAARIKTVFLF